MKKIIVLILIAAFLMISLSCTTIAANSPGPAPESGDSFPSGRMLEPEPFGTEDAKGPAPNSGDGIPDSSGF